MKRKWKILAVLAATAAVAVAAAVFLPRIFKKEYQESQKINEVLGEEMYFRISLGDAYLQEEVRFDVEEDRAVVPKDADWGLPKYREQNVVGVDYGEEGGVDTYESSREEHPELYLESYLDSVRGLGLTVKDVRDSGYNVKIVKRDQLLVFEEELAQLSGLVLNDAYELAGINIKFDEECRPVRKEFQLQKKDDTKLENEEKDSAKCVQEFHYDIGKMNFKWAFDKVKKKIEKEIYLQKGPA